VPEACPRARQAPPKGPNTDEGVDHAQRRTALSRAADLDPFLKRIRRIKLAALGAMTLLVECLAELPRHLDHLATLRPRVERAALERDLSQHNDGLFSLLMVAQLVVEVARELSVKRGDRFEDDTEAVRNLARDPRLPPAIVTELERLPGLRNVVHE